MNTFAKLSAPIALLALMLLITFARLAFADPPDSNEKRDRLPTVYEGAILDPVDPALTTFALRMRSAFTEEALIAFFDGDDHTTIFAPSNLAFASLEAAMSESEEDRFLDPNSGLLERVLRHHFTQGDWFFRDAPHHPAGGNAIDPSAIAQDQAGALEMASGSVANVYQAGADMRIDRANITDQIVFRNGVVAIIDAVVPPPGGPEFVGCSPFVSEHDNYLYFQTFTALSATYNWFSVTSCQPHASDPVANSTSFLVVAGRSDSSGPADNFKQGLSASNMLVTEDWSDSEPSELNFAFSADIIATIMANSTSPSQQFTCTDVRIGQGSFDNTNNWWVGQPNATTCTDPPIQGVGDHGIALDCDVASGENLQLMLIQLGAGEGNPADAFDAYIIPAGGCQ
jgi:uncharacterized surface protein with fasciclin (FAS1) repeats